MAVNSTYFGVARVTGPEADAFARKIARGRGTKAASAAAQNGKHMTDTFAKKGVVVFSLSRAAHKAK